MTIAQTSAPLPQPAAAATADTKFSQSVWQAPLVPVALAITAGILTDRTGGVPLAFSLICVSVCLVAWMTVQRGRSRGLPLVFLAGALVALGCAYHHAYREVYPPSDIGNFVTPEPHPARLRGQLLEEPTIAWQNHDDPLQSIARLDPTYAALRVTQLRLGDDWISVSGRARLTVAGHLAGPHVGDLVEVVGRLSTPLRPANPGEQDQAALLRDQRIRAEISVQKTTDGVTRLVEGWRWSLMGSLAVLRAWGQKVLEREVGDHQSGVATALLLGEGSTMTSADWEKYIRTGVIHALAISGQHLVVLGGFMWVVLRLAGVRRRRGAALVAVFVIGYALLAGGRPPIMRAAITVAACCGAIMLRRPTLSANYFALAWLVIAALNPTELFIAGCQLSFLAVAVLYWGAGRWLRPRSDALAATYEETLPLWLRVVRPVARAVAIAYAFNVIVWLAAAPLVAARYHVFTPVALLLGPPALLLSSVALLAGFLLLAASAICWPMVLIFASISRWTLAAEEWLVRSCESIPGGHWYVGDVPPWWLWVFYVGLLSFLVIETLRPWWRYVLLAGLAWLCVGLMSGWTRSLPDGLRCTFLAVGHGGCTVIETADGQVFLYDAGALGGPDVARRQIAPYLWSRGVRHIDEVFLSHADTDHFNGLPGLLERFGVGQLTCTPTFADKPIPAVPATLGAAQRRRVPMRIVRAGDRLVAGSVEMDVLHPPAVGPEGNENTRSMVLLVKHAGHSLLLTGDLEGLGLERVLSLPLGKVNVLMAPHHGSRAGNKREREGRALLMQRTQPAFVLACEGPPRWPRSGTDPYAAAGMQYLGTWPHGAITIESSPGRLVIETYQSGQRFVVSPERAESRSRLTRAPAAGSAREAGE